MKYQKLINLLDNTPNQRSKSRMKYWFQINDDSRGTYNTNSQIKRKTSKLKSSLCDYSDAYILVKWTITIVGAGDTEAARQADRNDKRVIFKNCAEFNDCIREINNTQVDNAKDLDVVMPMYNLIEYSGIVKNLWKPIPILQKEVIIDKSEISQPSCYNRICII